MGCCCCIGGGSTLLAILFLVMLTWKGLRFALWGTAFLLLLPFGVFSLMTMQADKLFVFFVIPVFLMAVVVVGLALPRKKE